MSTPTWEPVGRISTQETVPFSHVGSLNVRTGRSRYPITGGTFRVVSIAGALNTPTQGGPAVIGVNITGERLTTLTFGVGATLGEVADHTAITVTDGDYITVDIDTVGTAVPGADLVVNVRLQRVA